MSLYPLAHPPFTFQSRDVKSRTGVSALAVVYEPVRRTIPLPFYTAGGSH